MCVSWCFVVSNLRHGVDIYTMIFVVQVKLWQIPKDGLVTPLTDWWVDLHGHTRRVGYLEWHPTAENIILSAGYDYKVCSFWLPLNPDNNKSNNENKDSDRIERRNSRFLHSSSLHRELSPTRMLMWPGRNRVQIACNALSAFQV